MGGGVTISGDNNLLPENIAKDVNIFGVTGTMSEGGSHIWLKQKKSEGLVLQSISGQVLVANLSYAGATGSFKYGTSYTYDPITDTYTLSGTSTISASKSTWISNSDTYLNTLKNKYIALTITTYVSLTSVETNYIAVVTDSTTITDGGNYGLYMTGLELYKHQTTISQEYVSSSNENAYIEGENLDGYTYTKVKNTIDYGSITLSSSQNQVLINHNLGVIPTNAILVSVPYLHIRVSGYTAYYWAANINGIIPVYDNDSGYISEFTKTNESVSFGIWSGTQFSTYYPAGTYYWFVTI